MAILEALALLKSAHLTLTDPQKNKLKKRLQAREKELKEALKRVEAALTQL
jgi:hypothetical protein